MGFNSGFKGLKFKGQVTKSHHCVHRIYIEGRNIKLCMLGGRLYHDVKWGNMEWVW